MPAKLGVDKDTLQRIQALRFKAGLPPSDLLEARLEYADANQILTHYVGPMKGQLRIHPGMLPTQASGRWSTTDPPLVNFPGNSEAGFGPHGIRDVVWPDLGTYWLSFDYSAIEARIWAALADEREDVEAFRLGHDIHVLTACDTIFHLPRPTNLVDPHSAPEDEEWRRLINWQGKEDRRRHLGKTARYSLIYGPNEHAILNAKGVQKLGLTREELLAGGKAYLEGKPATRRTKLRIWDECKRTHVSRTHLGRRRLLFGPPDIQAKEGLNHMMQGSVADMMNLALIRVTTRYPECWLVLNKHDGADLAFPSTLDPHTVLEEVRPLIEQGYTIGGNWMEFPADWSMTTDAGVKKKLT